MHTCYSPVRRSPAEYCYSPLPLDLHVLSLSLAFILSQDQTLHGKSYFTEIFLWQGHVYESRLPSIPIHARYVVIFTSILLKNSSCHLHRRRFFRSESGCKDKAFLSFPPNLFRSFFKLFFSRPRLKGPPGKIVVNNSRTPPPRELAVPSSRPPFRFSGCKDKAKIPPFPNFLPSFFKLFYKTLENRTFQKTT